jgi:hypothetical protein
MEAYTHFDVPGIDLLGFQFKPDDREGAGIWLLTVLEAASVAAQLGKDTVMCEAFGGGGYECGPAYFKRAGDFLLAYGVNQIVPHMSYQTMAGARKYDWPQTISDHAPFWDDLAPLNRHQTAVATFLADGKSMADVLVLQPTASGWLDWTPDSPVAGRETELPAETQQLRQRHSDLLMELADQYIDFHLGDEWLIERYGSVGQGLLHVGAGKYRAVVVPPAMVTIRRKTLDLLAEFSGAGGEVVLFGEPPKFLDGEPSDEPSRRLAQVANPPRLAPMLRAPAGLAIARRQSSGGTAWFIANPWNVTVEGEVKLSSHSVIETDSLTCEERLTAAPIYLCLEPGEHRLWTESHLASPSAPRLTSRPVPVRFVGAQRMSPNVLPLHRCSLRVGQQSFAEGPTIKQNRRLWQAHGFQGDPWEWGVQFRRELVDAELPSRGAIVIDYPFECEEPLAVQIAVERPRLYQASFNGEPLHFSDDAFFDESMRQSTPVSTHIGANTLTLHAPAPDINMELAPVWVLGEFSLEQGRIAPQRPIALGDWRERGLNHYPWSVEYVFEADLSEPSHLRLELPDANGSSAQILINGQVAGTWWGSPASLDLGVHGPGNLELGIILRGSLRNLVGPFFCDALPGPWSWYEDPDDRAEPVFVVKTALEGCRLSAEPV